MASAKTWRARIKRAAQDAGTYRPYFDGMIASLADILARKDDATALYEQSGRQPVIEHTNKFGATNYEKNPQLKVIEECERTALTYWRDLGLTPAGLKKIRDEAMKNGPADQTSFADLLSQLTG